MLTTVFPDSPDTRGGSKMKHAQTMDADVNIFDDNAWVERAGGKILLYFGPHLHENLQVQQVDGLLRSKNAYGAFWNYDWDCGVEGPWYSIVCDIPNLCQRRPGIAPNQPV